MDMATVDAPSGLTPYGRILNTSLCCIAASPTPAHYVGHMVEHAGTSLSTPVGQLVSVITEAEGGSKSIYGVILALYDEDMDPVKYIAASEAGNSTIAGYALVADDPNQLYIIQDDGDSSSIQIADMGLNADCTGLTGSTSTGRSYMELDSDTITTTLTLALKVHAPHPHDTISAA